MLQNLFDYLLGQTDRAFEIQSSLTAVPALGPENGGQGELDKAAVVEAMLAGSPVKDIFRINSPDPRVVSGLRPNIIGRLAGRSNKTLWLFAHLDVVPPGSGWQSDPWRARREGDNIFGRGVEDNQQAITSMILLASAFGKLGIVPNLSLGLVFMADEECGSQHGLRYILQNSPDLFDKDSFYIAPDGGSPDAASIEVAEKAQLWLKFIVHGCQCHASAPQNGINAFVIASKLVTRLSQLGKSFSIRDELFDPPYSTFVPTRHDSNVPAINILPGEDVFYMDCRLLPQLSEQEVTAKIQAVIQEIIAELPAQASGASIDMVVERFQEASATPVNAPVVESLQKAIAAVYDVKARPMGIGGATVASFLRKAGLPAVVWSCLQNTCHMPDERSSLTAACKDAAVFAHLLMQTDA